MSLIRCSCISMPSILFFLICKYLGQYSVDTNKTLLSRTLSQINPVFTQHDPESPDFRSPWAFLDARRPHRGKRFSVRAHPLMVAAPKPHSGHDPELASREPSEYSFHLVSSRDVLLFLWRLTQLLSFLLNFSKF